MEEKRRTKKRTCESEWEEFDQMWEASGQNESVLRLAMKKTGMSEDTVSAYAIAYRRASRGEFDALKKYGRKLNKKFMEHLLMRYGTEEQKPAEVEPLPGQINMDEVLAARITEEDLRTAPERPKEDEGHVVVVLRQGTYRVLLQLAGFAEKDPVDMLESIIEARYKTAWDAAMFGRC